MLNSIPQAPFVNSKLLYLQYHCQSTVDLYLNFEKIKLEKSSLTNWILSMQKSISKLIFAGYTGSKNPVPKRLKIQSIEFDFYKLIFQKSSRDQQGDKAITYTIVGS